MKKNRFFYAINLLGFFTGFLLLAIILTFVCQELSFDRFHENAATIYRIHSGGYGVTPLCFGEKLKNRVPEIKGVVRFSSKGLTIVDDKGEINIGKAYYTDPEIFRFFSFKLLSGNGANALNAPCSIVINRTTANKLYGERSPIGETIRDKDGVIYTITGVMEDIPYNSHIQSNAFISIETLRLTGNENTFNCGAWESLTYVSLSGEANKQETESKLNSILDDSKMETSDGKIHLKLQPLKKVYFDADNNKYDGSKHGNLQTVLLYLTISLLILFVVIINYINLSTAISGNRVKEISIRKANGAEGMQIVKQILLEAFGVAIISFVMALAIIELFLPRLSCLLSLSISPSLNKAHLYLCYLVGISVIGLVTGLAPGIFLSKINGAKALKNEWDFSSRGTRRKMLLVFQLFIVATMLNSTFIITSQIDFVFEKDMGFEHENVISFDLDETLQGKKELLKNALSRSPGIEFVSFSDGLIGEGFTKHPVDIDGISKISNFNSIDPSYLPLYKIKLKYGRNFSPGLKNGFMLFSKEHVGIALISNIFAMPTSLFAMDNWLDNFQFRADIGIFVFFKTLVVTVVFALSAVSLLIVKTHKANLVDTLKHE